jgi:Amt family ammonium transporter
VEIDTGNTAWILASSALVLLMTPGLAFFYGGLNRSKSVLNMMMMSFATIGLISILWLFYGFSIAFGDDVALSDSQPGFFGDITQFGGAPDLSGETLFDLPLYVFMAFQMMFAIITVALISGAVSDRTKFAGWLVFAAGWFTLAYAPIAHMVWGGGFIGDLGVKDFAGGTAVHISAGAAALALALVVGRRVGFPRESFKPHNVPFVALGAGLLWFGWFGFNAGSELAVDGVTALAFLNTQVATGAALLGWILVEWVKNGKPTLVGASSGAVAGLVAITPACAYLLPWAAVLLGLAAGVVCALAVSLKYRFGFDDSLDVVGIHFVGGWIGTLWIGIFGIAEISDAGESIMAGGGLALFGVQAAGAAIASIWSFVVALGVALAVKFTIGLRVTPDSELEGIDVAEHKESAYDFSQSGGGGGGGAFAQAGIGGGSPSPAPAESKPAQPASV